jgi:hypothetical protein
MLAAAPSAGAAGWVQLAAPPSAATGVAGTPPSLAVDGAGDLWLAFVDSHSGAGTGIEAFERKPGGAFVSALNLPQSSPQVPRIAAGKDGTVAVAWETASSVPHVAIKPPGGTFGTPLQAAAGTASGLAGLTVLPNGTVLMAWTDETAPDLHVASVAAGGSLVDETPAGVGQSVNDVRLVSNNSGESAVSWEDKPSANKVRVAFAVRPPGGHFGAAASVATRTLQAGETSQGDTSKGLALDDAGDLAAVSNLAVDVSGTSTETLQAYLRPAGQATFTHAMLDSVTGSNVHGFAPAVVLDAGRRVTVVWANSSNQLVAASTPPAGTAFSSATLFTTAPPGNCFGGALAPVIAPLSGGGIAGLISSEPFPPFCSGAPLIPLSPAGGIAVTAKPAIEPLGAWTASLVPDGVGDAFAAVGFSPESATVPVVAYDATPPVLGTIAAPGSPAAGAPASLSVPASDTISSVSVSWTFGDGRSASGAAVSHTWTAPGRYTVTATAADGAGNTATTSAQVVVVDRTAPVISKASLAHRRFALARGATAISARGSRGVGHRPARGTTIRFTLSELATVRLTITHAVAGKRVGNRCVPIRARHTGGHKRCTAVKTDGTLIRKSLAAGPDRVGFSGQIGHRRLKPSSYRLRIEATDTAGNDAAPRTLKFTIVKR